MKRLKDYNDKHIIFIHKVALAARRSRMTDQNYMFIVINLFMFENLTNSDSWSYYILHTVLLIQFSFFELSLMYFLVSFSILHELSFPKVSNASQITDRA